MKKISLSFIISLCFVAVFGQSSAKLVLTNISINKKSEIVLNYKIKCGDSLVFYKIRNSSFCEGLAYLEIVEAKTQKEGYYYPCTGSFQLADVKFDKLNSVMVSSKADYDSCIRIKTKNLTIRLIKGVVYKMKMNFNFNNLESSSEVNFYNQMLRSNEISFKY